MVDARNNKKIRALMIGAGIPIVVTLGVVGHLFRDNILPAGMSVYSDHEVPFTLSYPSAWKLSKDINHQARDFSNKNEVFTRVKVTANDGADEVLSITHSSRSSSAGAPMCWTNAEHEGCVKLTNGYGKGVITNIPKNLTWYSYEDASIGAQSKSLDLEAFKKVVLSIRKK